MGSSLDSTPSGIIGGSAEVIHLRSELGLKTLVAVGGDRYRLDLGELLTLLRAARCWEEEKKFFGVEKIEEKVGEPGIQGVLGELEGSRRDAEDS